jgi:hypothetical protein
MSLVIERSLDPILRVKETCFRRLFDSVDYVDLVDLSFQLRITDCSVSERFIYRLVACVHSRVDEMPPLATLTE